MVEWNAVAYDRLSQPMQSWGAGILAELPLRGDETALDLGCGSGRLTEELLGRLPHGHVIAVDRSANMLEAARQRLEPRFRERVEYVQRSLDELDLYQVADLAFSNAAFHWILDHPRLFRSIFSALRPGGRLLAQCGAAGNLARLRERASRLMVAQPFRPYFAGWAGPWEFADAETTAKRLRDAGFEDIQTSAVERPVQLSTFAECRDFMEHVIFGTHLERIDRPELRAAFVERLAEQSAEDDPPFHLEYRRLNLAARRPVH